MMGTLSPSRSSKYFLYVFVFFLSLLLSLRKNLAMEGRRLGETHQIDHFHVVELSSLLPSDSCSPSTKDFGNQSTLKVVHKHGPCSQLNQKKSTTPTPTEVLLHDESRVNSIHKTISNSKSTSTTSKNDVPLTHATTVPAKSGLSIGTGNYIVQMGLGTPAKQLSLIFDTGSDLTWTQCEPCVKSCYKQKDAIFDPSQSSSYRNVSCSSPLCNDLESTTGNTPTCTSSTCVYGIQYGDSSYSVGFFGTEKLTVGQSDVFRNFYFGCGESNVGLFGGAAGLIGLGRDKLSLISQTASKYKKLFSYCLPSSASGTGYLTFGSGSKTAGFTPLSSSSAVPSNFYGLDFTGISVGGKKLAIQQSTFTTAGAIIDSGTVITRLPPAAYSALRDAFRQGMSKYPTAPALSILDTCYNLSAYSSVEIPTVGVSFNGGLNVNIAADGILYVNSSPSQVCLAFAANTDASDVAIFGNVQQKTLEVVYDVAKKRVGFASGSCS